MHRHNLKVETYMDMAELVAQLGTCNRLKVGCVILTDDGRVAGTGYNGAGPGMPHCTPEECGPGKRCIRTRHAERNALDTCTDRNLLTAFCTHEPCLKCAQDMASRGIKRIYYRLPYTSMPKEEQEARNEWLTHYDVKLTRCAASEKLHAQN